jgi:RNA polymerase sigma-70 factor (ECF subfamily)
MNTVGSTYVDSWNDAEYSRGKDRKSGVPLAKQEDMRVVEKLRSGDEAAFTDLVNRYHSSLLRLATAYVAEQSVAEEVVQDTWMGVLEGLDRFEGRSSLKTWIFSILTNKAKTRGVRERRSVPMSALTADESEPHEPTVDPSRFQSSGHWQDYWSAYPESWDENTPEKQALDREGAALLGQAIDALPPRLKQIIVMRDIEGLESQEVCAILSVSEANQRVLLHRARSRVRQALEGYLGGIKRK